MRTAATLTCLCLAAGATVLGGCDECAHEETAFDRRVCRAEVERLALEEMTQAAVRRIGTGAPVDTQFFPDHRSVQFDLQGCGRVNAADVVCVLTVTGLGFDWTLEVALQSWCTWPRRVSHAIDDMGNNYTPAEVRIADNPPSRSCLLQTLVAGVSQQMTVAFPNVHSDAESLAHLSLEVEVDRGEGMTPGQVAFRNVAIER
ncbi:MAG: hypothetical protein OXR73_32115 [Myxococcales bacterium]|nr:hypothetical protein [Myxococcales bacterium]